MLVSCSMTLTEYSHDNSLSPKPQPSQKYILVCHWGCWSVFFKIFTASSVVSIR